MNTAVYSDIFPIRVYQKFAKIDPRIVVLFILVFYLILGFTILGFNRTPYQAIVTSVLAVSFELILARIFKKEWITPLSALITSCSLSLLLNYSQNFWVLTIPVFFAIGSKYIFTFNGRHAYNPAQIAVVGSLLFSSQLITAAPAYQWNGFDAMGTFIVMLGVFVLLPRINRHWLVISFLFWFSLNTFIRTIIMKHHLPFETLFLGTLTSPAFFLFTFFMITDPATSPKTPKGQIIAGFAIAFIDLLFHLRQSYFTFFYAAATVQSSILIYRHTRAASEMGNLFKYIKQNLFVSGHWKRILFMFLIIAFASGFYSRFIKAHTNIANLELQFETISNQQTGIQPVMGDTLTRVDPRVQHLAKWLLSVGDSVAASDVNNDGLVDLFFSFPLKNDEHRNSLYLNRGDFQFERFDLPIKDISAQIEEFGLGSNGIFIDYDNDGDKDLLILYAFGSPHLLKNMLKENGEFKFVDVSEEVGIDKYTNSIAANFIDFNNDGRLDLFMSNVWPEYLPDYPKENPQKLNLFKLPKAEYEGDERMFNFMHASWHMANNGGVNYLYLQNADGTFSKQDSKKLNIPETRWSLAVSTADFNQDGWTDLYVANDFGADDLYYNQQGKSFKNIKGKMFGDIGMDTYKGMNATIGDFDNNLTSDVYISNVHHAYQAEGSLLWMWFKNNEGQLEPQEMATRTNALNELRFGWGAAAGDLNLDGHLDIVQANGMVDDTIDKRWEECPNYWYVNEKIARSAPSFHRYVNKWGDIRGFCIYGKEANRVYLNQGQGLTNMFVDVAEYVGLEEKTNSRGVAMADLDNNGTLDMVISHMFSGPTLYKNNLQGKHQWIGFEISSSNQSCNAEAIGSKIIIRYGNKSQMREKVAVNGFNAQSDNRIVFGLKDFDGAIDVEIDWCLKEKKTYTFTKLNQYHKVDF